MQNFEAQELVFTFITPFLYEKRTVIEHPITFCLGVGGGSNWIPNVAICYNKLLKHIDLLGLSSFQYVFCIFNVKF